MYPLVEPRQRPERFLLNRFSPLAENAAFLGLGGFDAAGSVWYPDARRLLGAVPNDGTLVNMDPATDWGRDIGRAVLEGDGSDDYVLVGLPLSGEWTWSGWIMRYDSGWQSLFGKALGTPNWGAFLNSTGGISCFLGTTSASLAVNPADNVWHHYAVVARATGVRQFYDGVDCTNSSNVATSNASTSLFRNWQDPLNGKSADACFWNRPLTQGEISALADPSNVMLEVGGVPLILPPHRVSFPAAVAEPSGFKPYWLRRSTQIIGGGIA